MTHSTILYAPGSRVIYLFNCYDKFDKEFRAQLLKASLASRARSGLNVNCSSKYSMKFTGIFAEKCE